MALFLGTPAFDWVEAKACVLRQDRKLSHLHRVTSLIVQWGALLLVFLWICGISTKDAARVILVISCLHVITGGATNETAGSSVCRTALSAVAVVFAPLMILSQISRVYLGQHGIDFAIFTQSIRSVRDVGIPITTLVSPAPVDFLSHHFFPFVYVLGWLSRVTLPPHLIGIVWQGGSLCVAIWCFYRFAIKVGFEKKDAGWFAGLLCLHPCIRSGVSWGIHDELFALGFIGIALLAWIEERWLVVVGALLCLGLFKETLLIAACLTALVIASGEVRGQRPGKVMSMFLGAAAVTGSVAVFYLVIRPLFPELFEASFVPSSRLATIQEWIAADMVVGKIVYILCVLGPVLFLPLLSPVGRCLLLCGIPFWGASLLSNFPEMYKGTNYYGVIPAYLGWYAALLTLRHMNVRAIPCRAVVVTVATGLALCAGYRASPFAATREVLSKTTYQPDSLVMIPSHVRVVASEFDSIFVLDKRQVIRQWLAERVPLSWDVLLVRAGTREPPSDWLMKGTKLCFADDSWKVYCRKGVSLGSTVPH
jgi:uncharacterized membrane protein